MPVEPPPSPWLLSLADAVPGEDLVGLGADLAPGTLLRAYRCGLFPMGLGESGAEPIGWWSPDPRGVLTPGDLHVSRSLRRTARAMRITVDAAFDEVVAGCADPGRDGRWITPQVVTAYRSLHDLGWAHSVEAWTPDGELAGGLYGLAIGRLFAAESMFHRRTDGGKAAVRGLVALMDQAPGRWLVDVQWSTPHLSTMGVREVSRSTYAALLEAAVAAPLTAAFDTGSADAAPAR